MFIFYLGYVLGRGYEYTNWGYAINVIMLKGRRGYDGNNSDTQIVGAAYDIATY